MANQRLINRPAADVGNRNCDIVQDRQQRHGFIFGLFCLWLLSMPFHWYSLVGTYSFDNLVAPLLCLGAFLLPSIRNPIARASQRRMLIGLILTYAIYVLASLIPVVNSNQILIERSWPGLRDSFYLLAPALMIRDRFTFDWGKAILIIITAIVAGSAILNSLGLVDLPVQRFAESRVDEKWLPKAIGLFSNYGDIAMLYAFTAITLLSHGKKDLPMHLGRPSIRVIIALVLLAGLAGAQSRNIVVTTGATVLLYMGLKSLSSKAESTRLILLSLILVLGSVALGVLIAFGSDIATAISSWGGKAAYHTASWRLETYGTAAHLIFQHPLIGLPTDVYIQNRGLVDFIHNMWLGVTLQGGLIRLFSLGFLIWLVGLRAWRHLNAFDAAARRDAVLFFCTTAAVCIATQFFPGRSFVMWLMVGISASSASVLADSRYARHE